MNITEEQKGITKVFKKDLSILEMIEEWSKSFGLPIEKKAGFPDEKRIDISMTLIAEEFEELSEAIEDENFTETIDALGDLLWVTVRAMMEFGIDPNECIKAIYASNMSKLDVTEEDAVLTYKKYMDEGIKTHAKQVGEYIVTYRSSDNKVMKSHKFVKPNFKNIK
jgi:NTP pyrophosphatase (non-canonical NTP hydrolase)